MQKQTGGRLLSVGSDDITVGLSGKIGHLVMFRTTSLEALSMPITLLWTLAIR